MYFEINGIGWEIITMPYAQLVERYAKYHKPLGEDEYLFGFCCYVENKIIIDEAIVDKYHTLYHELNHAYIYSVIGFPFEECTEEDVGNIGSRANQVINQIITKYFDLNAKV